jgi:hypothetical protein
MVHATLGIPAPPREGRGGRRWLAGGVGTGRRRKGGRDQACGAGGSTRRPELISGDHRGAAIAELRVRPVFRFPLGFVWLHGPQAGLPWSLGFVWLQGPQAGLPWSLGFVWLHGPQVVCLGHSGSFGCTAVRLVCLGRSGSWLQGPQVACLGRSGSFGCRPLRWSGLVARVRLIAGRSGGLPQSLGFVWLQRSLGCAWSQPARFGW